MKMLTLAISLLLCSQLSANWYSETLYSHWQQNVKMDEIIREEKSEFQDLVIFKNEHFGTVLALDGVIQTTDADEFIYHEMMTHVPLLSHPNPESILIIGGGDGGILREVLRHNTVKRVVLVEIDASVVDLSKEFLPFLSNGAFEDSRLELIIDDGVKYVETTQECFDVIICDSTDPVGPGRVLFTKEFYSYCNKALKDNGIFVNQNCVPFLQAEEVKETFKNRISSFPDATFYLAPIPTYVGGFMAFGWATKGSAPVSIDGLEERLKRVEGEMKYYNPEIHLASFALPNYIKSLTKS